jgi:hypothetical protein
VPWIEDAVAKDFLDKPLNVSSKAISSSIANPLATVQDTAVRLMLPDVRRRGSAKLQRVAA